MRRRTQPSHTRRERLVAPGYSIEAQLLQIGHDMGQGRTAEEHHFGRGRHLASARIAHFAIACVALYRPPKILDFHAFSDLLSKAWT